MQSLDDKTIAGDIQAAASVKAKTSILTLLGYQYEDIGTKKNFSNHVMVSPHTDVSVLTILIYDGNCAILQRQDLDGTWKDVVLGNSHSSNECQLRFIVNIGDCISDMTGGALKSTLHRVVRNPNKCAKASRFCLAIFI